MLACAAASRFTPAFHVGAFVDEDSRLIDGGSLNAIGEMYEISRPAVIEISGE